MFVFFSTIISAEFTSYKIDFWFFFCVAVIIIVIYSAGWIIGGQHPQFRPPSIDRQFHVGWSDGRCYLVITYPFQTISTVGLMASPGADSTRLGVNSNRSRYFLFTQP
jgi:hypothetical protein